MLKGFFISGSDTNVGKTVVAAILVNKLDAIYYKPIQCGLDKNSKKDSDIIKGLSDKAKILKESYFFKNPVSPNIAAKMEKKVIKLNKFQNILNSNIKKRIIIEGAGGLNVPINNKSTMIDLIKFFKLPLILVCRTSLGTINHTLLSIFLLKKMDINLHGLVFVGDKEPCTIDTIEKFGKKIYGRKINILAQIPKKNFLNKSAINKMTELFIKI